MYPLILTRRILISAPKESVRLYLSDLKRIAEYEPKVRKVEVSGPSSGLVEVSGRFLGFSWSGSFKALFTADGGYRAEMVQGPLPHVAGGYHLRPVHGGTVVTHEERYLLPWLFVPLRFLLSRWLGRTIERELGAIKEGAERLHRQTQLNQIESAYQ
ncbi:MAG: SRPBCC family protein [Elusimicrobia bacterium]|nr:SRPBCC family protein [Elusimicrobiota bacterium]